MTYEQATGKFYDGALLIGIGWAGHLQGRNNTEMQDVEGVGPLPKGIYTINDPEDSPKLGPLAFPLTPDPANTMYGRSGFFIHGASVEHPALSSDGCIIQGRIAREHISIKIAGTQIGDPARQLTVY